MVNSHYLYLIVWLKKKKFKKNPDDYIRNVIAPRIINDRLQKKQAKSRKKSKL